MQETPSALRFETIVCYETVLGNHTQFSYEFCVQEWGGGLCMLGASHYFLEAESLTSEGLSN